MENSTETEKQQSWFLRIILDRKRMSQTILWKNLQFFIFLIFLEQIWCSFLDRSIVDAAKLIPDFKPPADYKPPKIHKKAVTLGHAVQVAELLARPRRQDDARHAAAQRW